VTPRSRRAARARTLAAGLCAALAGSGCRGHGPSAAAAALYVKNCASCHAEDGRGVPARRGLEPRLDLSRSKMLAKGDRGLTSQRIAWGYNTMPGFAHKLTPGEIEDLVAFVETFAPVE